MGGMPPVGSMDAFCWEAVCFWGEQSGIALLVHAWGKGGGVCVCACGGLALTSPLRQTWGFLRVPHVSVGPVELRRDAAG